MSEAVLVDADDVGAAEAALSAAYSEMRLVAGSDRPGRRTRVFRTRIGPLTLDDAEFSFHVTADMDPSDDILLTRVRAGALGGRRGERIIGDIDRAHYDVVALDRRLLAAVAHGGDDEEPVDLTSLSPHSEDANRHLFDVLSHVRREVASNPHGASSPLVTGPLMRYLAGCVLAAFPHTAELPSTVESAGRRVLERALAYIDDHADADISMADVAAAARVTPQSLHAAFTCQLNCTPREYLRKARLHGAHRDLVAGDPTTVTVADVASRWGFGVVDAFGVLYRSRYGVSPETTLAR